MSSSLDILRQKLDDSLTSELPAATPRGVHGSVFVDGKATAIVGMRRAGKTTFAHQQRSERLAAGASRRHLPYINFEDERLADLTVAELGPLVAEFYRGDPTARDAGDVLWCFDEIQVVPGWERFVRRLLDDERVDVIVTGSSAALLSKEIATALRGRAWEVPIYPFGFEECLLHRGVPLPNDPERLTSRQRSTIESEFARYLTDGGFPEAQGLDVATRRQLLCDYVDVAMLRDVVERHGVSNVTALRWLVRHLLGDAGSLFSVEKFHAGLKSQGIAVSRDSVHQLLAHLTDCFLVRTVWMEARSERQRMVNPRKSYPVDAGLIPIFDRSGRANHGHALETAVLIELERRRCAVTYVRTESGFEVDFLTRRPDGGRELIQACADPSDPAVLERELRALEEAQDEYPDAVCRLLTSMALAGTGAEARAVRVEPAYVWMLRGD
jgi:hypothetical protein